jgi:hypothetical protein
MMSVSVRLPLVLALLMTIGVALRATTPVVADVQVVETGPDAWVVRLRSTEAQAFDEVAQAAPARVVVRLHGARISPDLAPMAPLPIGAVRLTEHEAGVDVQIDIAATTVEVRVGQGTSPNVVEVRLTRN